ncbi:restriction endonuclease subunit S [Iodobacter sp.]|uniref:restriction endonuclease subunit S n=1 Tax=Iodobacter sp. TaxID=1915058 RepID=UPI0025F44EF4|nr:restriction endonuclease subunit S [Iodobacter sp.]
MSKLVPNGWRIHELGDLAEKIEGGGTPTRTVPEFWSGNIPWVTVKDLKKVRLSFAEESISELGLKESSSRLIPKNTLIIATRMALGKAVIFDKDVTINQDLKAIFPKKEIGVEYLLHWYLSKSEYIQGMGTGSTVKGIRLDDLRLIPIKLPPLPEQQKIAAILTAVDVVIESTQAQINKLKALKTGLMQELLSKGIAHTEFKDSPVGRIPKAWDIHAVGDIVEVIDPQPDHRTPPEVSNGVPYVGLGNIDKDGLIDFNNARKVSKEAFERQLNSFEIHEGAFIFGKIGTIGNPSILPRERFYCLSANVILLTAKDVLTMRYLFHVFTSGIINEQVLLHTNTTSQPALGIKKVRDFLIPIPSCKSEIKNIVDGLGSIDFKLNQSREKLNKILDVKKALMQDLLSGKVRVKTA